MVMIVRIDDMNKPEELSEVWHQPLPRVSLEGLEVAHYLDGLEEQVTEVGWALIRSGMGRRRLGRMVMMSCRLLVALV